MPYGSRRRSRLAIEGRGRHPVAEASCAALTVVGIAFREATLARVPEMILVLEKRLPCERLVQIHEQPIVVQVLDELSDVHVLRMEGGENLDGLIEQHSTLIVILERERETTREDDTSTSARQRLFLLGRIWHVWLSREEFESIVRARDWC